MYKEIFSAYVPYRLPTDPTLTGLTYPSFYAPSLAYFTTPPRIYGEEFIQASYLFVQKQDTATSPVTITLGVSVSNVYGFDWPRIKFDGATGALIEYGPGIGAPSGYIYSEIVQSIDGSLWGTTISHLVEIDPVSYASAPFASWIAADFFEIPADQQFHGINRPMVDRGRNLIVMSATPASVDGRYILVNNLATGALLRRIWVSGAVSQILQESDRRCFVACTNGMIDVVDYTTGEIVSVTYSPARGLATIYTYRYAWDFVLRRLLIFFFADGADGGAQTPPINADGSSPNYIKGYYPVPIATNLTKPIPLEAPRHYRTSRVWSRVVGDSGEPMTGIRITPIVQLSAGMSGQPAITDNRGEAIFNVTGTAEGNCPIELSATVD